MKTYEHYFFNGRGKYSRLPKTDTWKIILFMIGFNRSKLRGIKPNLPNQVYSSSCFAF